MVFVFLFLTSLNMVISRSIHVAANGRISPFYAWVVFPCVCVCSLSSLFTHSWVSRHLACLHVLTVVNSAAVSIGVHVIFLNYVCLSRVQLFATPGTVAHQVPLSMRILLQARIVEWVAMPSSRRSSQPRDQTQISSIAGRFFTIF